MKYSQALFHKYPPPPEIDLSKEEIEELAEVLKDQPMTIDPPTPEDLETWGLESVEQYAIFDAYACWRCC